jgi:NAD-dependent DNA ligase
MIEAPTKCPSCGYGLEWSNDILYCRSPDCGASGAKRVEHFAKSLKIKGLGPAAIEKLDISSVEQIYELSIEYITLCLNSAKLALKLFSEIKKSESEPLNTVLPGFGISLVGKTAADKLSKVCDSIFDIDADVCKQAGLGEKVTSNLLYWLENDFDKYSHLPFSFEFEKTTTRVLTEVKGVVCISGKLSSFKTKAEATKVLEELGYQVKDSLTKDVTILVNESGRETDKTAKARLSGITIVNNLKQYIGE